MYHYVINSHRGAVFCKVIKSGQGFVRSSMVALEHRKTMLISLQTNQECFCLQSKPTKIIQDLLCDGKKSFFLKINLGFLQSLAYMNNC